MNNCLETKIIETDNEILTIKKCTSQYTDAFEILNSLADTSYFIEVYDSEPYTDVLYNNFYLTDIDITKINSEEDLYKSYILFKDQQFGTCLKPEFPELTDCYINSYTNDNTDFNKYYLNHIDEIYFINIQVEPKNPDRFYMSNFIRIFRVPTELFNNLKLNKTLLCSK